MYFYLQWSAHGQQQVQLLITVIVVTKPVKFIHKTLKMPKHCCWGQCRSDSRYPKPGVTFIPFPKPRKFHEKARRWVILCGRGQDFTVDRIKKDTYICSLHFPEGSDLNHKQVLSAYYVIN